MDIFTIGHSNYSIDKLIDMFKFYNINCVVDIRGTPYSKYNIQYNKDNIKNTLIKSGYVYIYMAKEFAAKRENKISYNKEGYSDFEKVVKEEDFINGIKRLKNGCKKGYRIVLLGAMQDPIRCHRSILLGRELEKHGFKINHILDDYTIKNQRYIEERILDKYFENRHQITIENLIGPSLSREEMIDEAYRMANKDIGYRIEHIGE
ncbi:Uncharacterized conserved protein [uncultured Clostridium sp.]|nr:Uncharacterized conserved protein [uncultured Clostridium sp.]